MPRVELSPDAKIEFAKLDNSAKLIFAAHFKKFETLPPRRHLGAGLPYFVENVGQGRIICKISPGTVLVYQVFRTHKEYEKWLGKEMK